MWKLDRNFRLSDWCLDPAATEPEWSLQESFAPAPFSIHFLSAYLVRLSSLATSPPISDRVVGMRGPEGGREASLRLTMLPARQVAGCIVLSLLLSRIRLCSSATSSAQSFPVIGELPHFLEGLSHI